MTVFSTTRGHDLLLWRGAGLNIFQMATSNHRHLPGRALWVGRYCRGCVNDHPKNRWLSFSRIAGSESEDGTSPSLSVRNRVLSTRFVEPSNTRCVWFIGHSPAGRAGADLYFEKYRDRSNAARSNRTERIFHTPTI